MVGPNTKRDALMEGEALGSPEERPVVGTDSAMYIVRQQRVQSMAANPRRQPQHLIRHGAKLHAHVPALHLLHDVGVPRQREAVANALCAEEQRVVDVPVRLRAQLERLAAVEEEGDVDPVLLAFPAELEELRDEVVQGILLLRFLADEVEP